MIRHDQVGTGRNLQSFRCHLDALFAYLVYLFEKCFRIDHHTIAEHTNFVRMDYSRRQQPQNERFIAYVDAMAGIMPALITRNYVETVREQVDNLSLALVAPLGTNNYDDHNVEESASPHSAARSP